MMNEHFDDFQRNSAFRKLEAPSTDFTSSDNALGVTSEMMQVINAQNILIMKLLQRQNVLYQQLNKKSTSSDSSSNDKRPANPPPANSQGYNHLEIFSSSSNRDNNEQQPRAPITQKQANFMSYSKQAKANYFRCDNNSSAEEEASELKEEKNYEKKKQTETKNMIKNFGKAIFNFIRKNREKRLQVLAHLNIAEEDFMKAHEAYKGSIHSISELRALWTPEGNPYHQAFRMLSLEYLRKHCLERTFNSRVENYSIHLKYRQRLLEGLRHPEEFTVLKTN